MSSKNVRLISMLVLSILVVSGLYAQTSTSGAITGRVTDNSAGLPGATVEVKSSGQMGSRTEITDSNGEFRFSLLPPGVYNLTASLSGFSGVRQDNIQVGLGRTVSLDVKMNAQLSEQITVTGAAPVVDVTSATQGANITAETMRTLPFARNFTAVAQVAPGTSSDAVGTTVYGSTGAENQYVIDGLNTTGVERGQEGKRLNTEFIQEVEVITGGLNAEYGRMTGGIINAITKSGSNEFHGDLFGYTASGGFQSDNTTAVSRPATSTTIAEIDKQEDYGANLGGYILKDRLWFFGAYDRVQQTNLSRRINVPLVIPGGTTIPVGGTQASDIQRDLYAGKLSLALSSNHSFNLSVFGDPSSTDGVLPGAVLAGPPSTYSGTNETGGSDVILRYSGIYGSNWTVNGSAGSHKEKNLSSGPGKDIGQVQDLTVVPNIRSGGYGFVQDQMFKREVGKLDISAFLGSHQIKFGGDRENLSAENSNLFTGGDRVRKRCTTSVVAGGAPCPAGNIYYTHEGYTNDTVDKLNPATFNASLIPALTSAPDTINDSLYVQDSWRMRSNLTLNLGVRWEKQEVGGRDGNAAITLDDNFAPRAGFIWDVMNNGRSKLYTNFGRFYESIPMDINLRSFGGEISLQSNNFDPTPGNFTPDLTAPKFASGRNYSFLGGSTVPVDPDLKGQYVDEILVGYDQEVMANLAIGIKGTYRDLGSVIEDMLVIEQGDYFIANPGSGIGKNAGFLSEDIAPANEAERKYVGVELHANKRFSNNYQMFASYLWSRLEGNYDGLFQVSTGQLDPNINSAYDYADFALNNDGLLSNDRTHQVKFYGSYTVPNSLARGLDLGVSAYWQSGAPLTGLGYEFAGYRNYEYYLTERGSLGRGPSDYEADIHIGYPINFASGMSVRVLLDAFNVLDRQSITQLDNRMDLSSNSRCAVFIKEFGGNGSSVCNGFGGWANIPGTTQPVGKFTDARASATNPDFLKRGTAFTSPRSIRVGARFSF